MISRLQKLYAVYKHPRLAVSASKRQMYGRAGFDLLRRRVLLAA